MANRNTPAYFRVADKGKPLSESLRQAFKDEIKLNDYLCLVWYTTIVAVVALCTLKVWHAGDWSLAYLAPLDGHWHSRDIAGNFYVESWATILINAIQFGLGLWGFILLAQALKRILTLNRFFFGCLSVGLTFCGFAYYLPGMTQPLIQMLVDRMPFLMAR